MQSAANEILENPGEQERLGREWLLSSLAELPTLAARISALESIPDRCSLGGDDAKTSPYPFSIALSFLLKTGIDHLDCLRATVMEAKTLHLFAPYTLMRSALEAGATAAWLIGPTSRQERIRRRLQLEATNVYNQKLATETLLAGGIPGIGAPEDVFQSRKIKLCNLANERDILDFQTKWKMPSVTTILDELVADWADGFHVKAEWQFASGMTHAKSWAIIAGSQKQEVSRDEEKRQSIYSLEPSSANVASSAWWATKLMDRVLEEIERRLIVRS